MINFLISNVTTVVTSTVNDANDDCKIRKYTFINIFYVLETISYLFADFNTRKNFSSLTILKKLVSRIRGMWELPQRKCAIIMTNVSLP